MVDRIVDVLGAVGARLWSRRHPGRCRPRPGPAGRPPRPAPARASTRTPTPWPPPTAAGSSHFGDRVALQRARFDRMAEVVAAHRRRRTRSGVLFDLGRQLPPAGSGRAGLQLPPAGPARHAHGPARRALRAADVVNTYAEAELASVLRRFGDERYAGRASPGPWSPPDRSPPPPSWPTWCATPSRRRPAAVAATRPSAPSRPSASRSTRELDILAGALDQAIDLLAPGGRIAVLSYHSGEDRIVKDRLRQAETGGCMCPPGLPCVCGAEPLRPPADAGGLDAHAAEKAAESPGRERPPPRRRASGWPRRRRSEPSR